MGFYLFVISETVTPRKLCKRRKHYEKKDTLKKNEKKNPHHSTAAQDSTNEAVSGGKIMETNNRVAT